MLVFTVIIFSYIALTAAVVLPYLWLDKTVVSPQRSLSAKRRSVGVRKSVDVLPDGTVVETKEVCVCVCDSEQLTFWNLKQKLIRGASTTAVSSIFDVVCSPPLRNGVTVPCWKTGREKLVNLPARAAAPRQKYTRDRVPGWYSEGLDVLPLYFLAIQTISSETANRRLVGSIRLGIRPLWHENWLIHFVPQFYKGQKVLDFRLQSPLVRSSSKTWQYIIINLKHWPAASTIGLRFNSDISLNII